MKTTVIFAISIFLAAFAFAENPNEKVIRVTTSVTENPLAISLKWDQIPGNFNIEIFKRQTYW